MKAKIMFTRFQARLYINNIISSIKFKHSQCHQSIKAVNDEIEPKESFVKEQKFHHSNNTHLLWSDNF
jgi:hypothetical protein